MLFKLKVNEVNSTIKSNTGQIEEYLTTVEDLQEENKKLKEYLQQLGSASTASESALDQLKTAYLMLKKIDPSQMDVLKQEVDNLYLQIKTSEVQAPEKIKSTSSKPLNNNFNNIQNKTRNTETSQSKVNYHNYVTTEKSETVTEHNVNSNVQKKDDVKAVKVEVLEPENNDKSSHYEAVMKLKQLID